LPAEINNPLCCLFFFDPAKCGRYLFLNASIEQARRWKQRMKIEIEMSDEEHEAMQMDLADIIWCLQKQHGVQARAIRLADKLESARKTQSETP
jgi:hypothetical protein